MIRQHSLRRPAHRAGSALLSWVFATLSILSVLTGDAYGATPAHRTPALKAHAAPHRPTAAGPKAQRSHLQSAPTSRARAQAAPGIKRKASVRPAAVAAAGAATVATLAATPASAGKGPAAEARLIEIYRLIGQERTREALAKAEALTRDVPNFQLAQLTYADLLAAHSMPLPGMGAGVVLAGTKLNDAQTERLNQLREEAAKRLAALQERPPAGLIPRQFIELPKSTTYAIAVDASRSRLYLFENTGRELKLVDDHYVSVGRSGVEKTSVGDQRTPLGVYFITNRLEAGQLADFYGTGALPLNYPNEYDRRQGRTGSGIWLHGVPSDSYARSPRSTDGCVALANDDLLKLMAKVRPRTTPVVIASRLEWVKPDSLGHERQSLVNLVEGWRAARITGDVPRALSFYAERPGAPQDAADLKRQVQRDIATLRGRKTQIKDLSILTWQDNQTPLMVVTFGEVIEGERFGPIKRQYWSRDNGTWKIFYEGVIG